MSGLDSTDEMVDFFVYCKEVNAQVANQKSLASDRFVSVLVANDLSGVKLIGTVFVRRGRRLRSSEWLQEFARCSRSAALASSLSVLGTVITIRAK